MIVNEGICNASCPSVYDQPCSAKLCLPRVLCVDKEHRIFYVVLYLCISASSAVPQLTFDADSELVVTCNPRLYCHANHHPLLKQALRYEDSKIL